VNKFIAYFKCTLWYILCERGEEEEEEEEEDVGANDENRIITAGA
jgi:hypothetical protein